MNLRSFLPIACLLLACLGPVLRAAPPPAPSNIEEGVIKLPKFEVKGTPVCSYGIGVLATWNRQTERFTHVYVDDVRPDSPAAKLGLQRGDEILSLGGRKITELKGGMGHEGEMWALLVDKPVGQELEVEVAVRVVKKVTLISTP